MHVYIQSKSKANPIRRIETDEGHLLVDDPIVGSDGDPRNIAERRSLHLRKRITFVPTHYSQQISGRASCVVYLGTYYI